MHTPVLTTSNASKPTRLRADLALLGVSLVWGSAFVAQRLVAANTSVFLFNGLRFLLAAMLLLPLAWLALHRAGNTRLHIERKALLGSILAGLLLFAGAALQQAGLRYTTAGNAGFITGLYVVLIPLIQAIFLRRSPQPVIWLAALLSAGGLFLLSTGGRFMLQIGDALELGGAVFWALHVIWIGILVKVMNPLAIAAGQYLICGVVSTSLGLLIEPVQIGPTLQAGWAILYTGIISVALGYTVQIFAQKVAPPADAAILLSMEAVFAALFGWLILDETLNPIQLLGCAVMLFGMLLAQVNTFSQRSKMLNTFILFSSLAWLAPMLACNFPGLAVNSATLTVNELRQTLVAQATLNPAATLFSQPGTATSLYQDGTIQPEATSPPDVAGSPPIARPDSTSPYNYTAQSGDTLQALAARFKVEEQQIISPEPLPDSAYLKPGQPLYIQIPVESTSDLAALFPDSEVTFSPSSLDFDIREFISTASGYLSTFTEEVNGQEYSGADIIERVARESSVNPRLLLAFLEYRTGWVFGPLRDPDHIDHPLGFYVPLRRGLYQEMVMAATHMNIGYYGWRSGQFDHLKYSNGRTSPINPWLNPGSVAVQNLFAKFYTPSDWVEALYGPENFTDLYLLRFGDPWQRAAQLEPFFLPGMQQPTLELPFLPGGRWALTGGPHTSWNTGSPRGALDLAPVTGESACTVSKAWVTASAPGIIVRSANNVVALDLDGDGNEQTGWVLVYLHLADFERIPEGVKVQTDDRLGHPSCARGQSTGTHVHITRKFNGEWLAADGPLPFVMSGWLARASKYNYQGTLTKDSQQVIANPGGPKTSIITRDPPPEQP